MGSSRIAAEEQQPADKPGRKRRSSRSLQRGTAALEGDSLSKEMMEQTMRTDESGDRYVDRAVFGGGRPQWYSVGVSLRKLLNMEVALKSGLLHRSFAHAASDAKCSETLCLVGLGAGVTVGQACCYVSVTPVVIPL